MRRIKLSAAMVAVGLLAAACTASYDREAAIEEIVADGFDRALAVCIVDGMEQEFGIDKLESNDDLTEEDEAIMFELTADCVLGG